MKGRRFISGACVGVLAVCGVVTGCSSDSASSPGNAASAAGGAAGGAADSRLFQDCEGYDCGDGTCLPLGSDLSRGRGIIYRFCTRACASDADCPGTAPFTGSGSCGVGPDGTRTCMIGNCSGASAGPYSVCQAGLVTACAVAQETFCAQCGCPVERRCEPQLGCLPLSDVGGPCKVDSDCLSRNCGAGKCFVALGAPCTAENCQLCVGIGPSTSCTKVCGDDGACSGGSCLEIGGNRDVFQSKVCAPQCQSSCPGGCLLSSAGGPSLCTCKDCLLAAGSACRAAGDCMSGMCMAGKCQ